MAQWECKLGTKDLKAEKKWHDERVRNDAVLGNRMNKMIRRQKLKEMYDSDEIKYEKELNALGLSYCRERLWGKLLRLRVGVLFSIYTESSLIIVRVSLIYDVSIK